MPAQAAFRPSDPLGIQRVIRPEGKLPQQAEAVDPRLPLAEDELLIEVESLNVDSASFHQISKVCGGNPEQIANHVSELIKTRGKLHNPVTGSGGMLIGTVKAVGPRFPVSEKPVAVGDRVATLVSLTLTPLSLRKVKKVWPGIDRIDVEGHAILFASGIFARLPSDLPEKVSLAVLDVAGAPAQTRKLVKEGETLAVIGAAGKSGMLCLYEAKRKKGVRTIAIDYNPEALKRVKDLGLADQTLQADARQAVTVMEQVRELTQSRMADVVINVANIPETEMSSILACKPNGIVYFFSMATSFTRAALGAEGVGADVDLRIGNGYTLGHADLALQILRDNAELRALFERTYG